MKSALRSVLIVFLLSMLVVSTEVAHGIVFSRNSNANVDVSESSPADPPPARIFLSQNFDNETTGTIPKDWSMLYPQYGNITVVNTVWYGASSTGKSAMIIDGYTESNPLPYRFFPQQTNTIVISFAINVTSNIGIKKTIEVYVDDSNFNGACIVFKDGKIGYRKKDGSIFYLRSSYVPDRWYKIKMILNIPRNLYNIHIDDHLEAIDAEFTGTCTQIHRIAFNETSGEDAKLLPVAYIDEIEGRKGIEIPRDYPTIQEGINAANESDIVFVAKQRTYFESVLVSKSIWLVGEDVSTSVIDGGFAPPKSTSDGIFIKSSDVWVYGFTVRSTPYGAGIRIEGSYNTIENNIVVNGLGDGISITGSNNTVNSNIIRSNLKCGVRVSGSNSTLTGNTIELSDEHGILIDGWNSTLEDNKLTSNLGCGILITAGEQNLVRNNTMRKNGIGVKCDAKGRNNTIYQNRFINNTVQAYNMDNTNKWDDGYPYKPDNEKGGGNYWSDFSCVDVYSGKNQDQHADCCLPSPDGVSDKPYILSLMGQDSYPLFLVQNVTQNPKNLSDTEYDTLVNVTATVLKLVDIDKALLDVQYDSTNRSISMKIVGNNLTGTIPALRYGTQVRYNITVHADSAEVWISSINYPPEGPYRVGDKKPPSIGNIQVSPSAPDVNQTIAVTVTVTEPENASSVDKVYVSYVFQGTTWKAEMTVATNNSYTAVTPPQPWDGKVVFTVSAVDKAGNPSNKSYPDLQINKLPELSISYNNVTSPEPCDIDFGSMYRGEKRVDKNLKIHNIGQEVVFWKVDLVKDGKWVAISPSNGTIGPGNSTVITISVDTTSLDSDLYAAEFVVTANGTVPHWVMVVRVTVRDIVIDSSYASSEAPKRCNVNETQHYGFHAKWDHNCTDALSGKVKVKEIGWVDVNGTGWANWSYKSADPANKTFSVEEVDFNYTKDSQVYHIKSFTQTARNLNTIWDRVSITLKIADNRIDVGARATITWDGSSVYELDNSKFNGTVYFNDPLIHDKVSRYSITVSNITDFNYGLVAFRNNIVSCIWDRIKIIGGGTSQKQTATGRSEKIWLIGIYEYDNTLLKVGNGTLFLSVYEFDPNIRNWILKATDNPMDWSAQNDRWEKTYAFDTQGSRRFTVSKAEDRLYNLTAIQDLVGPLDVTWLGGGWTPWNPWGTSSDSAPASSDSQPVPVQGAVEFPLWALTAIVLTLVIGLVVTMAIIFASGKKQTSKQNKKNTSP